VLCAIRHHTKHNPQHNIHEHKKHSHVRCLLISYTPQIHQSLNRNQQQKLTGPSSSKKLHQPFMTQVYIKYISYQYTCTCSDTQTNNNHWTVTSYTIRVNVNEDVAHRKLHSTYRAYFNLV
jgi:hypothetical protein